MGYKSIPLAQSTVGMFLSPLGLRTEPEDGRTIHEGVDMEQMLRQVAA